MLEMNLTHLDSCCLPQSPMQMIVVTERGTVKTDFDVEMEVRIRVFVGLALS